VYQQPRRVNRRPAATNTLKSTPQSVGYGVDQLSSDVHVVVVTVVFSISISIVLGVMKAVLGCRPWYWPWIDEEAVEVEVVEVRRGHT
jgi:hypothetical protein